MVNGVSSLLLACVFAVTVAAQQPPRVEPVPAPPDVAAPPADEKGRVSASKTASGLAWKLLAPGKGTMQPGAKDAVTVHYTAWTTDGKMFDNSHARRMPSTFLIENVVKAG